MFGNTLIKLKNNRHATHCLGGEIHTHAHGPKLYAQAEEAHRTNGCDIMKGSNAQDHGVSNIELEILVSNGAAPMMN